MSAIQSCWAGIEGMCRLYVYFKEHIKYNRSPKYKTGNLLIIKHKKLRNTYQIYTIFELKAKKLTISNPDEKDYHNPSTIV